MFPVVVGCMFVVLEPWLVVDASVDELMDAGWNPEEDADSDADSDVDCDTSPPSTEVACWNSDRIEPGRADNMISNAFVD